jgi:hypothetical protein
LLVQLELGGNRIYRANFIEPTLLLQTNQHFLLVFFAFFPSFMLSTHSDGIISSRRGVPIYVGGGSRKEGRVGQNRFARQQTAVLS